ncbi:hypothetical protein BDN71DRAFT_230577 [Pleurotus eryngii]|uniref:Uncharacterized protein n=1 Tax=Pleurotus eryngii TaxID=5323 RepID=A0A9P6DJF4_PLEER|nr:hypothetical protein BDN71DRAFT_230577 [Pleurotus eryngii]
MSASDLLSMFYATLEELIIQDIVTTGDGEGEGTSTIRLESLRSLELIGASHPLLHRMSQSPELYRSMASPAVLESASMAPGQFVETQAARYVFAIALFVKSCWGVNIFDLPV